MLDTRFLFKTLLILTFASLATITYFYFFNGKAFSVGQDRYGQVRREDLIQKLTIAGVVEPNKSTVIAAPYDGYVQKIYVKIGQMVSAGAPVVSVTESLATGEKVYPIRAPYAGTVVQVNKTEGQYVPRFNEKESILRIDDLTKLYVRAKAPEMDITRIKAGLNCEIKVSAVLRKNYKGIIREIFQAATKSEEWRSRSQVEFQVLIEVLDPDEDLKPGMSAVADIIANKKENILVLDHEYLYQERDKYFVITKSHDKKHVQVGLQNESVFEIVKGLEEGEKVQLVDFLKMIEPES